MLTPHLGPVSAVTLARFCQRHNGCRGRLAGAAGHGYGDVGHRRSAQAETAAAAANESSKSNAEWRFASGDEAWEYALAMLVLGQSLMDSLKARCSVGKARTSARPSTSPCRSSRSRCASLT